MLTIYNIFCFNFYSSLRIALHLLLRVLIILSSFVLISSDVIVTSLLSIITRNIIDFLPSGTWLPLYSSMNLTSLTLFFIESDISFHVVDSSTKIDKSFSTYGCCGIWVNLLSLEALGTSSSIFSSNTATLVRFILAALIVLIDNSPSFPITLSPRLIFR